MAGDAQEEGAAPATVPCAASEGRLGSHEALDGPDGLLAKISRCCEECEIKKKGGSS